MEAVRLGGLWDGATKHQAGSVWDKNSVAPTIDTMQGGGREPMIIDAQAIRMVRTEEGKKLRKEYESGAIHHGFNEYREMEMRTDGVSNTLSTVQKDNYICQKSIVAMRGRNPNNPSDRTVGAPTEQRLGPNSQGICNTLTSVQKDNLVMEVKQLGFMDNGTGQHQSNTVYDEKALCPNITTINGGGTQQIKICKAISTKGKENEVASTILAGYERTNMTGFNADNGVLETVKIKQATRDGYIKCEVGGVADLSFPDSKTRRGRMQENGQVSPTLMAGESDICRIEKVGQISSDGSQCGTVISENGISSNLVAGTHGYANSHIQTQYRIRKLTPRECWRLMDFKDEDFEKAAQVNSNTQLYKQAGNSIVKNVLVAILGQMIEGKEQVYKNI